METYRFWRNQKAKNWNFLKKSNFYFFLFFLPYIFSILALPLGPYCDKSIKTKLSGPEVYHNMLFGTLKHLFRAFGDLKKPQNRPKLIVFSLLHLLRCFFGCLWMILFFPSLFPSWILGFLVQNTSKTPFFGPLEASRGIKIGTNW